MPTREDAKAVWKPILRGTGLGAVIGVLPGAGNILAAFAAYSIEKGIAKDPSRFGKGAIEGVAAPEAANNAGAQTSFIPMLTLGIPTSPVMALLVGALIIQGIPPGPTVITEHPDLFWGLVASMWIGNLMLVVLNLPLVGIWVRLLRVPYQVMYPGIILFACIGIYSINNSTLDVLIAAGFGLFGYILTKLDCEPAPLMLGFVLGPMMEESFRRAMMISRGDPAIFLTRPISLGFLIAAVLLLIVLALPSIRAKRDRVFQE
jgi:TctA family transporter